MLHQAMVFLKCPEKSKIYIININTAIGVWYNVGGTLQCFDFKNNDVLKRR